MESLVRSLHDAALSVFLYETEESIKELKTESKRNKDCITKLTAELHALHQNMDSIVKQKEQVIGLLHDADHSFNVLREKAAISLQEAGTRYEASRNENLEKDEYIQDLRAEVDALHQKLDLTNNLSAHVAAHI